MEAGKAVATHQPHKPRLGIRQKDRVHGVGSEPRPQGDLDACNMNVRVVSHFTRPRNSALDGGHLGTALEGVLGRNQPPYGVQLEAAQSDKRDMAMGAMRGIERASQKADAPAAGCK